MLIESMSSDWNEELDKFDKNRHFADDISDSLKCIASVANVVSSYLPISSIHTSSLDELYEGLDSNGWEDGSHGYGYYRNGVKD